MQGQRDPENRGDKERNLRLCSIEGRFLIATDWPEDRFDEPQVSINDITAIIKEIRRICL